LAYLKTFFRVNGFKDSRTLEVERHYQPSRYRKREEWVPTSSEIHDMSLAAGSLRNRALVLALYTSGLRNSTLRALLYGDIREELEKNHEIIKVPVYPQMKKVDAAACKGNIPYYSFMPRESAEALRAYIDERKRIQGAIEDDEPLFCADSSNMTVEEKRHTSMLKKSLEASTKNAARNAGLAKWKDVYPHCLRKAFESAIRNAGLDLKDQEFLMGHILPGTMDTYYDKTKVEEMRRKYANVCFFPEKLYSSEDIRKKQIVDTARLLGFSEDRIRRIEEVLAKHKHVDEALKEFKRFQEEPESRTMTNGNGTYHIAKSETELIQRLHDGWKLVQPLNNDKYLLAKTG
jgi:site-specific recombinase XerD